jgi:hypothetical protein
VPTLADPGVFLPRRPAFSDRQDAQLILRLLLENRFPQIQKCSSLNCGKKLELFIFPLTAPTLFQSNDRSFAINSRVHLAFGFSDKSVLNRAMCCFKSLPRGCSIG